MGPCWSNQIIHTGFSLEIGRKDGDGLCMAESKLSPASLQNEGEILQSSNLKNFSLSELKTAIRNFSADCVWGEGEYGVVLKGWIDEHSLNPTPTGTGMIIAVKKLHQESPDIHHEWLVEINYVGQLRHPNLVRLIGYCLEDKCRLLVYEFVPRGSLDHHLCKMNFHPLSWSIRMKIALGAAKGLAFLHSDDVRIIYKDLETCNILLTEDYDAKLSDFGLTRYQSSDNISTVTPRVIRTCGYAAPEYIETGCVTAKSDVYSFGVVLLSGRRAIDKNRTVSEQRLVGWAKSYLKNKRKIVRVLDPRMEGQYSIDHALKFASIALKCLSIEPKVRPNMIEVVQELETLQGFQ